MKSESTPPDSARAIRTIKLLQIGDVHYPDWPHLKAAIDNKDAALSSSIADAVGLHPVQLVLREIATRINRERFNLIAVMGDLTSRGDFTQYKLVLAQLTALLDVRRQNKKSKRVVLVPGNHDVSRKLALSDGIEGKFAPLNDAITQEGWPQFPIRDVSRIDVEPALTAFLLNTCLGCGERRFIPEVVRDAIIGSLDKAISADTGSITLDEYYEQLDTPALDENAIRRLATELRGMSLSNLPVLIAHHNIFPQREPRLAPYAELLNGGQLRRALTQINRPIIYLHGHIHDDPIEILSDAAHPNSKLISISAPSIEAGFNEITIYVTADGQPCGCRIKPFRLNQAAGVEERKPIDLALGAATDRVRSHLAYSILNKLTKDRSVFWNELKASLPKKPELPTDSELEATVLELYFASYIRVDSIEKPSTQWRIEIG